MNQALLNNYFGSPAAAWLAVFNVVLNLMMLVAFAFAASRFFIHLRQVQDLLDVTKRYVTLTEDIAQATGTKIDTTRDDLKQTLIIQTEDIKREIQSVATANPTGGTA